MTVSLFRILVGGAAVAVLLSSCTGGAGEATDTKVATKKDTPPAVEVADKPVVNETFETLENWRKISLPKIEKHSEYSIEKGSTEKKECYLKVSSDASASGLACKTFFDANHYPRLSWRWRVANLLEKEDLNTKAGDDASIRVMVVFEFDPDKAGVFELLEYKAAKTISGEYPPHSSLNYVWAGKQYKDRILTNPYTGRAKTIVLQPGAEKLGTWVNEEVNILEDYRQAFGEYPPHKAGIVIMGDADNTGEAAQAYLDDLEIRSR